MDLQRILFDPKFFSGLLVQEALNNQEQDITLSRRQCGIACF
jgi:hypothetical protein